MASQDLSSVLIASVGDQQKEQELHDWLHGNFSANCAALAKEVADESKPFPGRQLASLYLKNAFNAKAVALVKEKHQRWKILDASARQPVKDSLLAAMRSSTPGVPHFTAICAAEIAAVELPYNEWPQFVPALMENVTSQQSEELVKLASLECLGYAAERIAECEEMNMEVPPLAVTTVDSMLTTIVDGVQPTRSDKMRFAALQALKNSLAFVKKNMQVKAERDFIMNAICDATQSQSLQVRELAYSCLDSIADLYYDKLTEYMTVIFKLTTEAIQGDPEEKVQMAAIEFWSTLAFTEQILLDEELACREDGTALDRQACPQYVKAAMESLVPILLTTLSKQDEDADDDELDLQSHGASCIEIISQTVEAMIVPVVIPFVQSNITHENWRLRDAGIVAFTCILDGPSTQVVGQYVSESIPVLMNGFNDSNVAVRDSATHCVSKICQLHIQAIPADQFHTVIQGLIGKLQEYPRVASHACSAIFNIAQSLKQQNGASNEEDTNMLSAPMLPLMQALLAASDREDAIESNLRVSSVSAAAELIGASARDVQHIFRDLMPVIVSRIDAGLKLQVVSNEDQENKEQLLGLLSGLMTALFQTMNKADFIGQADQIMNLLLQIFQLRTATCHEEAFLAVGAFASAMDEDFTKYMPAFMPFMVTGLRSFQSQSLCIVSVGVVVDICTAIGGQIQPFCDQIMSATTECLRDGSVHRDIKPIVISCFGDIAMAIGAAYEPYLSLSTMLLMQASSQQPPDNDDDELIVFINSLRLSILEAYSGIILGLSDGNALHLFSPNLPNILQFLQYLSLAESQKDEDVLLKAVALVGDIGQQMGGLPNVKQQIQQQFAVDLIQEAGRCGDPAGQDIAGWTQGVLQALN